MHLSNQAFSWFLKNIGGTPQQNLKQVGLAALPIMANGNLSPLAAVAIIRVRVNLLISFVLCL
jgi:hypothetical protein